jgi:leucyl-tRNA synthetase
MLPVIPHITSECLEELEYKKKLEWPKINQKYLFKKNIDIVIQVNGKKRAVINIKKNITEKELINELHKNVTISKYLKDKKINKSIFIQNKLINLIIK